MPPPSYRRGLLLPTVIDPPDEKCFIVHVPNDEGYVRAFWGALEHLGYWYAWEKEASHSGKDAAARWRESIELTKQAFEDYGDICQMEININCGCCNSSPPTWPTFNLSVEVHVGEVVSGEILALPGGNQDNGYQPPAPGWSTYNGYLVDKCAYANKVATDIYNSWENLSSLSFSLAGLSYASLLAVVGTTAFTEAIVGVVGGVLGALASWPLVVAAFVSIAGLVGVQFYNYFEALQDKITLGDLVCALYGASDAENARSRLLEAFEDWGVEAGLDVAMSNQEVLGAFMSFVRLMMPVELLEPLFDNTDYAISLPAASCTACLGVGGPEGLADSILHYYELEEASGTRVDAVTGGVDLTSSAGTTGNEVAISGFGLRPDATVGNYGVWSTLAQNFMWGDVSLSATVWCRNDLVVPSYGAGHTVFHIGDSAGNWNASPIHLRFQYGDGVSNNRLQMYVGTSSTSTPQGVYHSLYVPVGDWVFCALVHDADNDLLMLSLNGGTFQTLQTGGQYPTSTTNRSLFVGLAWASGATASMKGGVDEIALYDKVLTPDDVGWIYNNGFGRSYAEYFA